jgi:hypothetical protein
MNIGTQASGELRWPPGAHIPALDGLRATAILLVIIIHTIAVTTNTLPDRIYRSVISVGWIGVDLFFVLSGFLITRILYDAKGSKGYFRNFYARRALRIFPLYYGLVHLPRRVAASGAWSDQSAAGVHAVCRVHCFLPHELCRGLHRTVLPDLQRRHRGVLDLGG